MPAAYARLSQDDDEGANGHSNGYPPSRPVHRRRWLDRSVTVGLLVLAGCLGIGVLSFATGSDRPWNSQVAANATTSQTPQNQSDGPPQDTPKGTEAPGAQLMTHAQWQALEDDKFNPKHFVKGPATQKFRDNIRPDIQYMSGWIAGGWTNDFMTYINLVYMAFITQPRVPIIGQFHPTHVGQEAGFLHFGDVFDVPRLSTLIRMPVLEWRDVKDPKSQEVEEIGCWSAWAVSGPDDDTPRHSFIPEITHLDISYTDAPKNTKVSPEPADWWILFWPLAQLAYPQGRKATLEDNQPRLSPIHNKTHPPDEHLVCYDFLYFAGALVEDEWFKDFSPAWREIGTHTHWTKRIEELTQGYLQRHFHVASAREIPPFIVIHARRADFEGQCGGRPIEDCFASMVVYDVRVKEMKAVLKKKHGVDIKHVLMTSDERNKTWWEEVKKQGWSWVDHDIEQTEHKYGRWYPVLLDAAIQSMAKGFIGTAGSTMSMVGARRVEDWNDGISVYVNWGEPGADNH